MPVKQRARGCQPRVIRITLANELTEYVLTKGVLEDRASVLDAVRRLHTRAALLRSAPPKGNSTGEAPSSQEIPDFHAFIEQNDPNSAVTNSEMMIEELKWLDCDPFPIDLDAWRV
jgi:hypothetical protein